ncbi:hypothetical protein ACQKWADRAFT_283838 [Trichoderma austrokoningii]
MDPASLEQLVEAIEPDNKPSRRRENKDVSGADDTSTDEAASKKAEAKEQQHRKIMMRRVRHHDGREMELPVEEDFSGYTRLPHQGYWRRLVQFQEQINKEDPQVLPDSIKAPAPWAPDPFSDEIQFRPDRRESEEDDGYGHGRPSKRMRRNSNVSPKARRYYRKFSYLSKAFVRPGDESDEELPEHEIQKTPPTFMGIAREIRMKIYRHLLLNSRPITVHGEWKRVHRSNRLSLPMSILGTCKLVHDEACVVLYGENVFVYLLRDPVYSQRAILNLPTNDDVPSSDDESDSGSEYEDEEEEDSLFCNDHGERCIDTDKYAHLFRKIVVEAEHNRYSRATQESMATAIGFFGTQADGVVSRGDACNIRTLTIRVSPLWNEEGGEPGAGRFTFIDFFETNSPVIQAIKTVDCQTLHVEILTRYMSRQSSNSAITWSEDGSVRLTVDRRWERYHNMVRQGRAHLGVLDERDKVMRLRMREMTNRTSVAIDELARHVEAQCNERNFHQDTTMGLAVNWPNINFDDLEVEDMDMEY